MKSVVILISGRGSNMIRIAQSCLHERSSARVACVVSNRAEAPGLEAARRMGLPVAIVDHRGFASRQAFDEALAATIESHRPDVVALAGFMRILGEAFVTRFAGRLINIHPSLLPAFPGLNTHERVLRAGCKAHGATVHFVTAELDAGPIIGQAVVPVLDEDTPASLMTRVQAAEHRLYPQVVSWLVGGRVMLVDGVTRLRPPHDASDAHGGSQPALQWFGGPLGA